MIDLVPDASSRPFRALLPVLCLIGLLCGRVAAQVPAPPDPEPADPPLEFALIVPDDLRIAVCDPTGTGAVVVYPAPVVRSECPSEVRITCDPPSGSVFPPGSTVVSCTVVSGCGERATGRFVVTVVADAAPPVLECPRDLVVYAPGEDGIEVDYPLPVATDDADDAVQVACDPPSGSRFPVGVTTVLCVATDACGRQARCQFTVDVRRARLEFARTETVDPATGARRPALRIAQAGWEGFDAATELDGEWTPLGPGPVVEDLGIAEKKFFRPPSIDGAIRVPEAEIAYVQVGPLAAYDNAGIDPARGSTDVSIVGAVRILSGTTGGGANNLWSGPQQLPFTFRFFGRPYTRFRVSKNGLLTFSTNVTEGTEGLGYFSFPQASTTNLFTRRLPLWNASFGVDNTIFGFAGRYVPQTDSDGVYAFLHGTYPRRQVWIVFHHPKDFYGDTTTAIVLEEQSNRILLMDMQSAAAAGTNSYLLAGIQGTSGSAREVREVAANPQVRLMARTAGIQDNGCYLFRPYELGRQVSGQASDTLLSNTNLNLLISERLRQWNIPGVTVAVSRNGRLVFNRGYGFANVELGETMKSHHRACIGSVSKVLAAIGVERLVEEELLPGIDVLAYTPERLGKSWFWDGVTEGFANGIHTTFGTNVALNILNKVTIRHLLSHSAALANRNDDAGAADAYAGGDYTQLTPQQQVRWFMATQQFITNDVRRISQYSNPSFKQVGVLIEEVAGQRFEDWMRAHVLQPAGVTSARLMRTFEEEETWRDARRYAYYGGGDPWIESRITGDIIPPPYGDAIYANAADGAAGSWTATAAELVRLMAAIDGLPNRPDILDADRIAELDNVAFPSFGSQGVGFDSVSVSASRVQKNGNIGYGSSHLMRATTPDRLTVAVVANSGTRDAAGSTAVSQLARDIYTAMQGVPAISPWYDLFGAQEKAPNP